MKPSVRELIAMCRRLAADPRRVVAGGGNASVKDGDTMYIKASGAAMSALTEADVVAVSLQAVRSLMERTDWPADRDAKEDAVVEAMLAARVDPAPPAGPEPALKSRRDGSLAKPATFGPAECANGCKPPRPSVETLMHAAMPWRFVFHVHPVAVNALACSRGGRARAAAVLRAPGVSGIWMTYGDPGLSLGQRVCRAVTKATGGTGFQPVIHGQDGRATGAPNVVILANHGLLVGAESAGAVGRLVRRVELLAARASGAGRPLRRRATSSQRDLARAIAPVIRGAFEDPTTVLYDGRPALLALTADKAGAALAGAGPISPDQIVYAGVMPAWVSLDNPGRIGGSKVRREGPRELAAPVRAALKRFERRHGQKPRIVLVQGLGGFSAGPTPSVARAARDVYWSVAETLLATSGLGGPRPLTRRQTRFIDTWGAEQYRRARLAGVGRVGRVGERVILITGAGQGVGEGLARGLAAEGAHVICADIQGAAVSRVAEEIRRQHGPDAALAVTADCTSSEQMTAAVQAAVDAFGGLDVLISNAGILFAHKVTEFPPGRWRKILDVNLVGYFVSAQAAARVMALQGRGDIIQINSKSGKKGSRYNSAYAASKFGGVGLTQSLALDLAEDGVRVNCICPGNFFDLPLWQASGGLLDQYAANYGGISRREVLKRYLDQIPLGRGARVEDVIKTFLYILEQTYETGQAYNVTGGQETR